MGADICTGASALQLAVMGLGFLAAVVLMEVFWVRLPHALKVGDRPSLKRRSLLNLFVALGAGAAAAMLFVWVTACGA